MFRSGIHICVVTKRRISKLRRTKFQRSTAGKSESIQEDLHLALLHHRPHFLLPIVMKKEGREDPSPGPRDQRMKEKKLKSRTKDFGTNDDDGGPVCLSKFFGNVKS
ncbi:hypothetical protein PIB30_093416 [Stylosanthes scabra]|uniref:Uncharacterized protein n=1 Tax=Stylosanthes scabra TaxID=79078 RepID=A0ABU6TUJ0_9FABA|nr:hypothetical protein [Stylosanthes scabra]